MTDTVDTQDTAETTDAAAVDIGHLKHILEAVLLAAGRPLSLDQLQAVFSKEERPARADMRKALAALEEDFADRGVELVQVASGYRIQVRQEMQLWVSRLREERPTRYSRALLETLSLIAYRQPITRGEIEEVRGVTVSSSIMKTLLEREWVRIVGHRDVPGHPAMYGTTRQFLDYFGLKGLDELPSLAELRDLSTIGAELELDLMDAVPEMQMEPANDEVDLPAIEAEADQPATGSEEDSSAVLH
ncbi:MAG: SMC-Scp complex subunit ScpB [Gammaproteobacteria bacterium]|nr:SMC-Scp complex subunit ScpB [Gammaproteobacteria bacterium]